MAQKALNKEGKNALNSIQISDENLEIIRNMLKADIAPRSIWKELNSELKQSKEIQNLFLEGLNKNNYRTVIELLGEQGVVIQDIYSYIEKNNEDLFKFFVRNDKIPIDDLTYFLNQNPEYGEALTVKSPLKEITEKCPKVAGYLSDDIKINKENIAQNALGETKFWKKDGEPIQYLKLGNNLELEGREDYLKFVNAYISEDKSIPQFCEKYCIKNPSAFAMVISQIESEDKDLSKQIQEVKTHSQERYIKYMQEKLIPDILSGETTYEETISSHSRINIWDFINAKAYVDDKTYVGLVDKMMSEMGIEANISKRRPDKEQDRNGLEYKLIGNKSIEELNKWFCYDKKNPTSDVVKGLAKLMGQVRFSSVMFLPSSDINRINALAESYEKKVDKNELINGLAWKSQEGELISPAEENFDKAIQYLKATERCICQENVKVVLKAITFGQLSEEQIEQAKFDKQQKDTEQKRIEEQRYSKVKKAKSVDEYLIICQKDEQVQEMNNENNGNIDKLITLGEKVGISDTDILTSVAQLNEKAKEKDENLIVDTKEGKSEGPNVE